MDIFDHIKSEHDKFRKMAKEIDDTTDRAEVTRTEKFAELKKEIVTHHKAEEVVLVPVLKDHEETRDMGLEIVEEHDLLEVLLPQLSDLPVTDEKWGVKFGVMKELLEHHLEEEENEITDKAREVIDKDVLEKLNKDFGDERTRQKEEYDRENV